MGSSWNPAPQQLLLTPQHPVSASLTNPPAKKLKTDNDKTTTDISKDTKALKSSPLRKHNEMNTLSDTLSPPHKITKNDITPKLLTYLKATVKAAECVNICSLVQNKAMLRAV